MPSEGVMTLPGLTKIIGATVPRHHGITPNCISIECAPQDRLPPRVGTLTLQYDKTVIKMPECLIDSTHFKFDERGNLWSMKLFDFRWKWKFLDGKLNGRYNVRLPNGPVDRLDPLTEKPMRELIDACTKLIKLPNGKKFFVLGDVPKLFPQVYWASANPAAELQKLCDSIGFRVVPLFDGTVLLQPKGTGRDGKALAQMPKGLPVMYDQVGYDPPEIPNQLVFIASATRFQVTLPLDPVADDVDGTVRPLDKVSYKPTDNALANVPGFRGLGGGWGADLINFMNVKLVKDLSKWYNLPNPRELARASVYRKFRVRVLRQDGTPFVDWPDKTGSKDIYIPGCPVRVDDVRQILPMGQQLLEPVQTDEGWFRFTDTIIWGQFANGFQNNYPDDVSDYDTIPKYMIDGREPLTGALSGDKTATVLQPDQFSLDGETGIVTINGPILGRIYKYDSSGRIIAPNLWIRTTVQVSSPTTWVPVREETYFNVTGVSKDNKIGAEIVAVRDADLFRRVVPAYGPDMITLKKVNDTSEQESYKKAVEKLVEQQIKTYQDLRPAAAEYIGWHDVRPDGGREEVVFTLSQRGSFTQVSLFNERFVLQLGYEDRRFLEKAADERSDPAKKATLDMIREKDLPFSRASGVTRSSR